VVFVVLDVDMLNSHQKQYLKTLAHARKPVVIIGARGITEAVLAELDQALNHHEILKVRVNAGDRKERRELCHTLCEATGAELVQQVGHVVTLFRANPEAPGVTLPNG